MRRSRSTLLTAVALSAALGATACTKDPTEGKTAATVSEAKPVEQAAAAPAGQLEHLNVNVAASTVGFVGAKVTAEHKGEFKEFEGQISLVNGKIEGGRIEFQVKTASVVVDGGMPKLEEHLRSPDFFDAAGHPVAKFVSTEIKPGSTVEGMNYTVTGNLDIRGNARSVTFPARITIDEKGVSASTEFGINRKDFGIQYPGMPDDLIKDNVLLKIDFQAERGAPTKA